jgi:glycosyltransferase involved in cell wall biosynthesis
MRILFLTSHFPYPPNSGAALKTWSVYEYLRKRHDVTGIAIGRAPLSDEQQARATEAKIETVVLDRGRNAWNVLLSYLHRVPLSVERNRSGKLRSLVAESLRTLPDAVFVDGWLMAQYLPVWYPGLKLLHEHNAEYRIWQREAAERGRGLTGPLLRREANRVRSYESSILGRFDTVFAVSEDDRRSLAAIRSDDGAHFAVLPNIPDPALLAQPALSFATSEPLIFYFGTLSWQPNIDGLQRLIGQVFPEVLKRIPEARLAIAGRDAPQAIVRLANEASGVDFIGPVDDPEPLYGRARVFVEATKTGGGTRLKVLNALARGLPVVASSQAAQGLDVVPGDHLIIARSDREMTDAISLLMTDAQRWRILSENGRALVRGKYVAEVAFGALDQALTGEAPSSEKKRRRRR